MPAFLPCSPLDDLLMRALRPCAGFSGQCAVAARWAPGVGHVPRGFVGALGTGHDVELVIVTAEPGDPRPGERQEIDPTDLRGSLARICEFTYRQIEVRFSTYHANLRTVLDLCWPGLDLKDQLRRTWVTESVLCSAPKTTGRVPHEAICGGEYLGPQLAMFPAAPVIALGGKAQRRLRTVAPARTFISAFAVAPPGCNAAQARASWATAAALAAAGRDRHGRAR